MRGPSPLYIEERHRALGRDATFSWSRALTHPPRCNRTRHRGPPSWCRGGRHLGPEVVGAAILDRKSWGPPSWTGSDVKSAKVAPILLICPPTVVGISFLLHTAFTSWLQTLGPKPLVGLEGENLADLNIMAKFWIRFPECSVTTYQKALITLEGWYSHQYSSPLGP